MIKAVLFDLDGTLLPMQQDKFVNAYFSGLAKKAAPYGYKPDDLIETIWKGTNLMVKNDGQSTNEDVFWNFFAQKYGVDSLKDKVIFDEFYNNEFQLAKTACGVNDLAKYTINTLKSNGYRLVLATNPIFPQVATLSRINWAGLDSSDFEIITTYENSCHCKPNLEYYKDILNHLCVTADECLMVGNDVNEDMIAKKLGLKVFLITDCLINKNNVDIFEFPHGDFNCFDEFIKTI